MSAQDRHRIVGTQGDDYLNGTQGDDAIEPFTGVDQVNGRDGYDRVYVDYRGLPAAAGTSTLLSAIYLGKHNLEGFINGPSEEGKQNYMRVSEVEALVVALADSDDEFSVARGLLGDYFFSIDAGGGEDVLGFAAVHATQESYAVMWRNGWVDSNLGFFSNFERVSLFGGHHDDLFGGGALNDTFFGNGGYDTVTYEYADAGVTIRLRDGAVDTEGAGVDTFDSIENLIGSAFDDVLVGNAREGDNAFAGGAGDDRLNGRVGRDTLDGGIGDDVLLGGDGADVLTGGGGRDALFGGFARDVLDGGMGTDRLAGGAGADTFRLGQEAVALDVDRIADFTSAEGDRIDLSPIEADAGAAGDQAFAFLGSAAFTGIAGELRWEAAGGDAGARGYLRVEADVDGDARADLTLLVHAPVLSAADFVL